jgi:hypothetical protein
VVVERRAGRVLRIVLPEATVVGALSEFIYNQNCEAVQGSHTAMQANVFCVNDPRSMTDAHLFL